MLLAHNPAGLPVVKSAKRLDGSSIPRQYLLSVECAEPVRLLSCLWMGPQHPALPPPPVAKKVRECELQQPLSLAVKLILPIDRLFPLATWHPAATTLLP
jgi:hypothetical protein